MSSMDIRSIPLPNATHPGHPSKHPHAASKHDFAEEPKMVYWEMTQACGLACRHCRAEAVPSPHPNELTTEEGKDLLRQIAAFDHPHLVFTGGDPLRRTDLFELIDEARSLGINASITPSATTDLTPEVLAKLKDHGIDSFGLSLDGSTAERHEAVRGIEGCYNWTINAAKTAGELGVPIQINTLVAEETVDDIPAIYELLKSSFPVMRWSLFFLIEVGRGRVLQPISSERGEQLMNWIYEQSKVAPFAVATTEAPSYRRVALSRMRESGMVAAEIERTPVYRGFGIRDGHGIVFISNQGDICPAGFLPLALGSIRTDKLIDVYRNAPMFKALHDPNVFKGKCGRCEYRALCGGSRARAFAATGDALASDPFCHYEPAVH